MLKDMIHGTNLGALGAYVLRKGEDLAPLRKLGPSAILGYLGVTGTSGSGVALTNMLESDLSNFS
jgi:hypothetical protein